MDASEQSSAATPDGTQREERLMPALAVQPPTPSVEAPPAGALSVEQRKSPDERRGNKDTDA